jgi:hypothetical protein
MAVLFSGITLASDDLPRSKGGEMLEITTQEVEFTAEGTLLEVLRVVAPLATNLLWAVILLVVLPRLVGIPLWVVAYPPSDLGLVVVLSGGIALIWGVVLRPVLALLTLRAKVAPRETGTPEQVMVRVPA